MQWAIFVCLLVCLARFCEGGAIRCPPGVTECTEKTEENVEIKESSLASSGPQTECLAGTEWESNCHYCRCSNTGIAECLKGDSCEYGVYEEPYLCKPNTTFLRECNTCVCLENGLVLCSLQHCVDTADTVFHLKSLEESEKREPLQRSENTDIVSPNASVSRKVRALSSEPPKTCTPGQEFRLDCNKCLCDDQGTEFSCTRIDCTALNNAAAFTNARSKRQVSKQEVSSKCEPGSVFDRDCNVCRCTEDGFHATCTLKKCPKPNELDTETRTPDSDLGFRCNAGEQFKHDCNDCTCSADGKSVFCTLRLCDLDINPTI